MKLITKNKKAFFDYEIVKSYESGIELKGYEVKSIRSGHVNLKGSFLSVYGEALYIRNMHVTPWKALPNSQSIDGTRERKVFLHKKDIAYLASKSKEAGNALIPLELYFSGSLIKLRVALAKGKKKFEKKQILKERDLQREAQKIASRYI